MTDLVVAGIKLESPAPSNSGTYDFINPFSNKLVRVKDEKVAAACEFVIGVSMFGRNVGSETFANFNTLRAYIAEHDSETYMDLID